MLPRVRNWRRRWGSGRAAISKLVPIGAEQARMAGDVIGPVPGQSALPLLAQGALQFCQQLAVTLLRPILYLVGPQSDEPRQVAGAAVGLRRGGQSRSAIAHAGRIAWAAGPGRSQASSTNPTERFDDRAGRRA
jgi:hypothetical protein